MLFWETLGFPKCGPAGPLCTVGRIKGSGAHLIKSQQKVAIETWFWAQWKRNNKLNMKKWQSPKFGPKWGSGTKNQEMLIFASTVYKWPIHAIRTSYKVKNTLLLWPRVPGYAKSKNIHFFFQFLLFLGSKWSKKCIFCLSGNSESAMYNTCSYTICSKNAIRLTIKWSVPRLLCDS